MNTIDIISASIFAIIFIIVIYYTRRTKTFEEFSVSNRTMGVGLIFASLSATFIGPGFSLALVNQGFNTGLFYVLVAGFYGLAKIFEGAFVADKIRSKFKNSFSIGDIIAGKNSHNNKYLKLLVGILSFCLLVGFSAVIAKAGGELMNYFFGIEKIYGIIIISSLVGVYSFFGGIKATIYTDAFQFLIFVILIPLILIFAITQSNFDISTFNENISSLSSIALTNNNYLGIFGLAATWFFGELFIPPTISRILSTKNPSTSKKAMIYSGIFMIVWLIIMLLLGIVAKTVFSGSDGSEQLLLMLGENYLFYGLFGVFVIAMISIVMSSLDSLINSASIIFTHDILKSINNKPINNPLLISRYSTILVVVFATILTTYFSTILGGLLFVYSVWAPAIVVPLLMSVYLDKPNWLSAFVSIILGVLGSVLWSSSSLTETLPPIIFGLFSSLTSYLIIHYLTSRNNVKTT